MDVYMFKAAMWCEDCIRNWLKNKDEILIRWPNWYAGEGDQVSTEDMLREYLLASGYNPDKESTWDSDKAPKGPFDSRESEADHPEHCDCCGAFLENRLTTDGYNYVYEAIQEGDGDSIETWRKFYGNDGVFENGRTSINERLRVGPPIRMTTRE